MKKALHVGNDMDWVVISLKGALPETLHRENKTVIMASRRCHLRLPTLDMRLIWVANRINKMRHASFGEIFMGVEQMASRADISLLRSARAGQVDAQVALGRRYLAGGAGLPQSVETGLYWLSRAARQGAAQAWILIGTHVPFDVALRASERTELYAWYERAFDDGLVQAGLALAKLVFVVDGGLHEAPLRRKAWQALERAAEADIAEAQWLLVQLIEKKAAAASTGCAANRNDREPHSWKQQCLQWARRAANNGIVPAQRWLADYAWEVADDTEFLHWALPIAQALAGDLACSSTTGYRLDDADRRLLSQCAQALFRNGECGGNTIERLAEPAAGAGDKHAQLCLGLWFSKMDKLGKRVSRISRQVNYRMAIKWLMMAGQQGLADAWYVISRIYLKAEFAQRSIAEAERFLKYAAQAGHCGAQLELGKRLWRKRRIDASNDVDAAYWLHRASAQGCDEANQLLRKIASPAVPAVWAQAILNEHRDLDDPLLAARIKLAARFGLSKHEALLLNLDDADCGHCMLVDIRDYDIRARRRLIIIQTSDERRELDGIKRVFERATIGKIEHEGSYRQRLYRLDALMIRRPLNAFQHTSDDAATGGWRGESVAHRA
ncbi:hypothetical protein [Herbaspirillum sp. ST 5-3]|uniref:tetratricopeptide repeat protein n=1 Tax=Oxalobacteraceae TaxID=75682 RepID=UPI00200020AA|nr:hypothetical protein [Herbaspirillum sp. ST 5-3]